MALFWPQVKKKRGVRPIVRRYLTEYMKSRFLRIELSEMLIAVHYQLKDFIQEYGVKRNEYNLKRFSEIHAGV